VKRPWAEAAALALLGAGAAALAVATAQLVVPWRDAVPWYESAGSFPRAALALVVLGALAELVRRWRGGSTVASEELDSGAARLPLAAAVALLFAVYALSVPVLGFAVSTAVFLLVAARLAGLAWRIAAALALPLAAVLWLVFVKGLAIAFGHGLLF